MQLTFFLQNHLAKNIMQFRQTEATIDLGLKTVTWTEHGLDNHGDTGQLTDLREEYYELARSNNDAIEETIAGYCRLICP